MLNNKSHLTCSTNEEERIGNCGTGSAVLKGKVGSSPFYTSPLPVYSGRKWIEKFISQNLPLKTVSEICDFRNLCREDDTSIPHILTNYVCTLKSKYRTARFPKVRALFSKYLGITPLFITVRSFLTLFFQCIFFTDYNYYSPAASFSFWSFVNLVIMLPQTGFPKCQD